MEHTTIVHVYIYIYIHVFIMQILKIMRGNSCETREYHCWASSAGHAFVCVCVCVCARLMIMQNKLPPLYSHEALLGTRLVPSAGKEGGEGREEERRGGGRRGERGGEGRRKERGGKERGERRP